MIHILKFITVVLLLILSIPFLLGLIFLSLFYWDMWYIDSFEPYFKGIWDRLFKNNK